MPSRIRLLIITGLLAALLQLSACSTMNVLPPEVNLMRVDVQDVTLSHVNLLAGLRVFNPNSSAVAIQDVDYTLHLEGIRVFSGRSSQTVKIEPQEYGYLTLRISSAYWDIMQLFNRLPDKTDVAFSMNGSLRVGGTGMFPASFSFEKKGVIPLQKQPR